MNPQFRNVQCKQNLTNSVFRVINHRIKLTKCVKYNQTEKLKKLFIVTLKLNSLRNLIYK